MSPTRREQVVDEPDLDLLRRRVLNVIGHELRTPVTTLRGLADELVDCHDPELRQELTEALARNARRLDRLVEDLLLASGVSTAVPGETPQAVDLAAAAHTAWARCTHEQAGPSVRGTATALARPAVVHRVLEALFANAVVHGEAPIEVAITDEDDVAVLEVSSGGPALSTGDLLLACEPFYRGERAVTTRAGLGLGLPLARNLARADDGDVSIRAGDRGGVVARVELPAARGRA